MDTAVRFNILRGRIDGFSSLCVQRSAKSASRKITGGNVAGTIATVTYCAVAGPKTLVEIGRCVWKH